jgi:hypothetical protein
MGKVACLLSVFQSADIHNRLETGGKPVMKAIRIDQYGEPDVLHLKDVEVQHIQ